MTHMGDPRFKQVHEVFAKWAHNLSLPKDTLERLPNDRPKSKPVLEGRYRQRAALALVSMLNNSTTPGLAKQVALFVKPQSMANVRRDMAEVITTHKDFDGPKHAKSRAKLLDLINEKPRRIQDDVHPLVATSNT